MTSLESIDKNITLELGRIKKLVNSFNFTQPIEFNLKNIHETILKKDYGFSGIYLFEIKNSKSFDSFKDWTDDFETKWTSTEGKFPKLIKKRIKMHSKIQEWTPLYLGKSQHIMKRIKEHLTLPLEHGTYALKLLNRSNMNMYTFRVRVIRIGVENYDTILPLIENEFRNKIHPITGKQ